MKENSVAEHKRLLLIDDDPNLILLVKDYLESVSYTHLRAHET
jgi:CheY-like chemotaxis protein